jgi:hypothetical protein
MASQSWSVVEAHLKEVGGLEYEYSNLAGSNAHALTVSVGGRQGTVHSNLQTDRFADDDLRGLFRELHIGFQDWP